MNLQPVGSSNLLVFTIATNGYTPFVLNLYASIEQARLAPPFMAYSLDEAVHDELTHAGVPSVLYARGSGPSWSDFGTSTFARTMAFKYAVALDHLTAGQSVLYMDSDIVVLRDPLEYLNEVVRRTGAELTMQVESPAGLYNAGLWLARPTPSVVELFTHLRDHQTGAIEYVSDQQSLNGFIQRERRPHTVGLDPELFACGNQFLKGLTVEEGGIHIDRRHHPFPRHDAYLLHFNFLVNRRQKLAAMQAHGAVYHKSLAELIRRESGPLPVRFLRRLLDRR